MRGMLRYFPPSRWIESILPGAIKDCPDATEARIQDSHSQVILLGLDWAAAAVCLVVNDWWLTSLDWAVQNLPKPTQKASVFLPAHPAPLPPLFSSSHNLVTQHPLPHHFPGHHFAHSFTRSISLINPLDVSSWTCRIYPVDLFYPGLALAYRTNQHDPFAYPPTLSLSHTFLPICLIPVLAAQPDKRSHLTRAIRAHIYPPLSGCLPATLMSESTAPANLAELETVIVLNTRETELLNLPEEEK